MVPNTEDPEAKYNVPDTMDNVKLLEERTLYYLNQYRLQDGVQEATALLNGKTYKYAKMRAEQLADNCCNIRFQRIRLIGVKRVL